MKRHKAPAQWRMRPKGLRKAEGVQPPEYEPLWKY
jgi:hypothetical protein